MYVTTPHYVFKPHWLHFLRYGSWRAIKGSPNITLRNSNEYLRQRVVELVLSHCKDDSIREKAQSYTRKTGACYCECNSDYDSLD